VPDTMTETETLSARLERLASEVTLAENFGLRVEEDAKGWFLQITCWRRDVITGEMGEGHGGKFHPSEHSTESELLQAVFGLYLRYVEHEARETFEWRGRRIYGPHISAQALYEVARRVDVRSARHEEDQR